MLETKEAAMNTTSTSRLLIGLTLVLVGVLLIGGLYYPGTLLMGFAGTTAAYALIRGAIILLLLGLLVTQPPRSRLFRVMLGTWAVALAVLAGQLLLTYQIFLLDAIMFIEIAIIFGVEALEPSAAPVSQKIKVRKSIAVATVSS